MRFVNPVEYPTTAEQGGENTRYLADSLYDGQHDVNFNSASIVSAYITNLVAISANITSASITSAKIGTLQGLLLGTAGLVSAVASGTTAQYLRGDVSWATTPSGDVAGPGSSTDNAIARFNGTGGKTLQNSAPTIDDSGNLVLTADIYNSAWAGWTPTISVAGGTAPTYTSVFTSRYRQVGKLVYWYIIWNNASGGTAGAGTEPLLFSLPVNPSTNVSKTDTTVGGVIGWGYSEEGAGTAGTFYVERYTTTQGGFRLYNANRIIGNDQSSAARYIIASGFYEID